MEQLQRNHQLKIKNNLSHHLREVQNLLQNQSKYLCHLRKKQHHHLKRDLIVQNLRNHYLHQILKQEIKKNNHFYKLIMLMKKLEHKK